MKFGYFDDKNKEYVINRVDTPLPWINYLGNDNFFSLISNTGGGYSFYKDAKLRRLTRYRYNNVPKDLDGRHFYIISDDGKFSPTFLPLKTKLDKYECHHGLGYTRYIASKYNIDTNLTFFVPTNDNCEIAFLQITNNSSKEKKIRIISEIEFCLYNAQDDMSNFQRNFSTGEIEVENNVIYHKTEYRERRNHFTFYSVNKNITSFNTDRDTFLGKFNDYTSPEEIFNEHLSNKLASGWSPIAANEIIITLKPGESEEIVYMLGYIENEENDKWESKGVINKNKAYQMIEKYDNAQKINDSLNEIKTYWENLLNKYNVKTNDEKLDRMVNIWNQYQCVITYRMSRSASYYESGIGRGMGFRDSCQDIFGFVHMMPNLAKERILDIAAIQLEDGSTWHQYQPLTKKGNADVGGGFNDDPLWLVSATYSYIAETGDNEILDISVPFNNDKNKSKSLLEHLRRSVNYTINHLGPHNLPLIGRADWNDCLNLNCFSKDPSESFQTCSNFESGKAESTFIGALFIYAAKQYIEILKLKNEKEEIVKIEENISKISQAMLSDGWDGEWFVRAYDAFEHKVGSKECDDGKIFIEPQGFAVMAGLGLKDGKAEKALKSVQKYLDTKYGIVLLQPAYKEYHLELGEVSSYPPGYKENAGIFCHNNPWISCAETCLNHGDRAYEIYKKICPAYLEEISEIHKTEPYVYSQMVAGKDAVNFGEGKNSWLTGTASWTFVNISQYILGIIPTISGLKIRPCLPSFLKEVEIDRVYRNKHYHIIIKNTGEISLTFNGNKIKGDILPHSSLDNNEVIYTY